MKATVLGNQRNGPTELYDKSGKLMRIANYKSDILDGTMIHYYSDGVVADSVEYKCGKKYGYFRKYNKDGSLHEISYWYFDLQYGPFLWYQKNDMLKTFSFVDFGKKTIATCTYNSHGNLDSIESLTLEMFADTLERDGKPMLRLFAYLPKIPLATQSYSIGLIDNSNKMKEIGDIEGNNFFIDTTIDMPPDGFHYYLGCNLKSYENSRPDFFMVVAKPNK